MHLPDRNDTICALATAPGMGAIAVIRISGANTFDIINKIFQSKSGKSKDFKSAKSHTLHFGNIIFDNKIIDEVLLSVFKNPMSYTGEDTTEISCHGSTYIQQQLLQVLQQTGARLAEPGEFTLRAFLNGKLDLTQAEAVADLISSQHASAHTTAIQQLRGGYNSTIQALRQQLMDFASLIELELDFAEEDVEFANRDQLRALINGLLKEVKTLRNSFDTGNAMKNGIPVVIAGKPNVGKSTLLNALLNEEKAIVSEIAGTTRDVVEDQLIIDGYRFRFMDTAGIRHTTDTIEKIGVEKTYLHAEKASIALYLCDPGQSNPQEIFTELEELKLKSANSTLSIITVVNKTDQFTNEALLPYRDLPASIFISAKNKTHLEELKKLLIIESGVANKENENQLVTNARHAASLLKAETALAKVIEGMNDNLTSDFLALELKEALYQLGNITGEIYTDDLLGNIFSKFCIGK
ncbi:MAG TPA: tRNA uridine-5-carboxymethylaminomethyl(34) synthesis GTPase MnmE [Bacteroidia bacterium]|jgi:tRNA modification GTPase|nr:tRNA uridine-5-carboxymethylaminomethyl(34) synthesis GTPase MnmE [Bacteroidia bacterium]HQF29430.1 tRNA uridine-5-carboxymethylaminomethyl(34) synthesis GTPase MnmE [Bacteroidia bacterium]